MISELFFRVSFEKSGYCVIVKKCGLEIILDFLWEDNMKRRLLMMIIITSLILICSCYNERNAYELKTGKYVEVDNGLAWVVLKENNEFEFNRGIASYRPKGRYRIQDGQLILEVSDKEEYKFKIDGEILTFESGTYIKNLIKDGAVFQLSDAVE